MLDKAVWMITPISVRASLVDRLEAFVSKTEIMKHLILFMITVLASPEASLVLLLP